MDGWELDGSRIRGIEVDTSFERLDQATVNQDLVKAVQRTARRKLNPEGFQERSYMWGTGMGRWRGRCRR